MILKYLYGIKGCAHCSNNKNCPTELKDNPINLRNTVKVIEEGYQRWETFCEDFAR